MAIEIPVVMKPDKFEKQLRAINGQIQQEEKKKISYEVQIANLEQQKREIEFLNEQLEKLKSDLETIKASSNTYTGKTSQFFQETKAGAIANLENLISQKTAEIADKGDLNAINAEIDRMKSGLSQSTKEAKELKGQTENLHAGRLKDDIKEAEVNMKGVGSSIQGIISKVGRLALSIIGIGSAISMLRSASSQLAQYDEGYAAKLEYIRFALAQAIAPVLQWIVNMAGTVLALINAIIHALTGVNIFANAGKKAFENMKNSTGKVKQNIGGAAKGAAQLKKQLMGFDEANVLQENGSVGGGGGGRRR